MSLEWLLARRYLQSNGGRFLFSTATALSILGICIGVATLISVTSVMNGFSAKLLSSILGMNGHVTVHCNCPDYPDVIAGISIMPGVVSATPVVEGQAMLKYGRNIMGAVVRGMRMRDVRHKLRGHIVVGDVDMLEEGIVLGFRLAESIGADYGDEITVISPETSSTIFGAAPRTQTYRVTGIFDVGVYEYDSAFAYIPLRDSQLLFGYMDRVRYVEVFLRDVTQSSEALAAIARRTGLRVEDWKVQQGQYFRALELERDAMFFILALIVIVAAFNIISGISVLVRDKRGAIAIMRTMGVSRYAVMRIFCMCGAFIGMLGTGLGCVLGVAFSANIESINSFVSSFGRGTLFESIAYCLDGISPEMMFEDIAKVVALSLGASLLAAVPPAIVAARQNPVDILRYE
ncbi:lipoprotein releasing system, transmembrane protein [Anaplasma centrale str. Israel]|uniref:Lipoprotein releasing system, transmembrane protein n=1 Tax=Anaplasma centrale (strain Israel) TaxID=574556 RepID=D1ATL0_ANACI|nr:lipoprotein-releasing ABC transporter permease subunit [Anaplasma centrale]ACZ48888.1 lipoprotein releasing system, transmembrane protein [Anaplasma centrale str. Israel]